MPRKYVKTVGKRTYQNYSSENVAKAVKAVNNGKLSIRQASKKFGVSYGTIFNKKNGLHNLKNGGQTMLSESAEKELTETIKIAGEWGFPLTKKAIQNLVRDYMDSNNIPMNSPNSLGKDWCYGYMERNKDVLSLRKSQNIKRSRAKVSPQMINSYFDKLAVQLEGIPPENIVNYDETNFVDDPESKKVLIRKGQRHADDVQDHSKSSYSVMFAAAANGFILPPYVVYASVHLYSCWTEGGPKGARYNRSKSGWFEKTIYEDWFFSLALPYFKRQNNTLPKVLIGDNVASHISYKVMKSCIENGIRLVFLPPNATHICQPLDVSVFRPLKQAWRKTLDAWKKKNKGSVPKHTFPRLLKKTLQSIEDTGSQNVISGFKATGIFPCDRQAVLKQLPGGNDVSVREEEQEHSFSEQLIKLFKEERYMLADKPQPPKRKRILKLEPGESVGEEHLANFDVEEEAVPKKKTKPSSASKAAEAGDGTVQNKRKRQTAGSRAAPKRKRFVKMEPEEYHDLEEEPDSEADENEDPNTAENTKPAPISIAVPSGQRGVQRNPKGGHPVTGLKKTSKILPTVKIEPGEGDQEEQFAEANVSVPMAVPNKAKPASRRGRPKKPKSLR